MGNAVGRTDTTFCDITQLHNAYAFGLWCADGYHRTSSIGVTNVDKDLITHFRKFLEKYFPTERIKMRVYSQGESPSHYYLRKATQPAYQLYVNSRPLLRYFREARRNPKRFLNQKTTPAYLAGRFDGDGSVAKDGRFDLRIVYGARVEAEKDAELVKAMGFTPKVYEYKKAKTFALYISRLEAEKFLSSIRPYSLKRRK